MNEWYFPVSAAAYAIQQHLKDRASGDRRRNCLQLQQIRKETRSWWKARKERINKDKNKSLKKRCSAKRIGGISGNFLDAGFQITASLVHHVFQLNLKTLSVDLIRKPEFLWIQLWRNKERKLSQCFITFLPYSADLLWGRETYSLFMKKNIL